MLIYLFCSICFVISLIDTSYKFIILESPISTIWNKVTDIISPTGSFIVAMPYMMIGKYFASHQEVYNKKISVNEWLLLVVVIVLGAVEAWFCHRMYFPIINLESNPRFEEYLFLVPMTIILARILPMIKVNISDRYTKYMRKSSILIFLSHQILLLLIYKAGFQSQCLTFYLAGVVTSSLFAYLIIELSSRVKVLKYLY